MSEQAKLRNKILGLFVHAGDEGRTDAELAMALRANKNTVPTRRRDLELNGLVQKTARRRNTDTGAGASIYVVTQKGIELHASPDDAPPRPKSATRVEGDGHKGLLRRSRVFLASMNPPPGQLIAQIDKVLS